MAIPPLLDPGADALFLDFDGTLVGFADDPAAVRLEPGVLDVLTALQRHVSGAFAIVSGRRIDDLDRFLAPLAFAAAGVHGLEQRPEPGGDVRRLTGPQALDRLRSALWPGLVASPLLELEDKGTALVLHSRRHPELGPLAEDLMRQAVGDEDGFVVLHGKNVVEVHLAGMDKGRAVDIFCQNAPFAGRRPVYIGDDATDEFALRVVRKAGGVSIKVGLGDTDAQFRLGDVPDVHRWLSESNRVAGQGRAR
ncbi:trehalose phosphatase [Aureimonas sp. Leaf454]|uniref:trehalose-phosphatase n=1 Tax=Aureimonas sp. Leaf454 TaxID=1736381 RepID=UPI0006F423C6|nr:trehalose-phosphatase [Aureimonas sp. Leaf454]KQT54658.1 trehalose phosphatase [Aureimonas sp. Leaf454]